MCWTRGGICAFNMGASLCAAGIMYTTMPRADLVGTARFVDHKSSLCCEVVFGKVADSPDDPLLQRTDSFHGTLYKFSESGQSGSQQSQVCLGLHFEAATLA